MTVLGVDPGRSKCGLAAVNEQGCLERGVVAREELAEAVRQWSQRWPIHCLVVGGATGSRPVVQELRKVVNVEVVVVDEYRTSERARQRYFEDHPPQGLWKLVPLGLQTPPVAIDDYAALVMAEEYLVKQREECG